MKQKKTKKSVPESKDPRPRRKSEVERKRPWGAGVPEQSKKKAETKIEQRKKKEV